jgi:hypothetical protein
MGLYWVVVDDVGLALGYATWDPKVDPPWPVGRGRLIPMDPESPPEIGSVVDEAVAHRFQLRRRVRLVVGMVGRYGGWVAFGASVLFRLKGF